MIRRRWPILAIALGLILAAVAAFALRQPSTAPPTAVLPSPAPIISPLPSPSATPASATNPPDGMRIKLPELQVDLPVVAGNGVDAPLYKAVLYPKLQLPGSGNRSLIYAHARTGMFGPLFHAKVGQHIEIDSPGAQPLRYVITEYYPHWSSTDLRWLAPLKQEQLVLVTCTTYNLNDPRIIVVAQPA